MYMTHTYIYIYYTCVYIYIYAGAITMNLATRAKQSYPHGLATKIGYTIPSHGCTIY